MDQVSFCEETEVFVSEIFLAKKLTREVRLRGKPTEYVLRFQRAMNEEWGKLLKDKKAFRVLSRAETEAILSDPKRRARVNCRGAGAVAAGGRHR